MAQRPPPPPAEDAAPGPSPSPSPSLSPLTLDRSNVRILLCDRDPIYTEEVRALLWKCSYQVTAVKTARQILEVLNSASHEVDLILSEVELPKRKGFKLLKHIVRQETLKSIPVVMMSACDEMAVVVKCLRLGAVDYLVKPLRTNELLNLWTHMWRRRRLLGLAEKRIISGNLKIPFDLLISETSESTKTNSSNLFSDDTDDRIPVGGSHQGSATRLFCYSEKDLLSPCLELSLKPSGGVVEGSASVQGFVPSPLRKTELRIGKNSAFLSYTKFHNQTQKQIATGADIGTCKRKEGDTNKRDETGSLQEHRSVVPIVVASEGPSSDNNLSTEAESCDKSNSGWNLSSQPSGSGDIPSSTQVCSRTDSQHDGDSPNLQPLYINGGGGVVNQQIPSNEVLPPAVYYYQGLPQQQQQQQRQDTSSGMANGIPSIQGYHHHHHLPTPMSMPAFSFYPLGVPITSQPANFAPPWSCMTAASRLVDHKQHHSEKREAALNKFRQKRKDRNFEKKIRYATRKKLAEQRPRVRGQFVRRGGGDRDMIDGAIVGESDADADDDNEEDEQELRKSGD